MKDKTRLKIEFVVLENLIIICFTLFGALVTINQIFIGCLLAFCGVLFLYYLTLVVKDYVLKGYE